MTDQAGFGQSSFMHKPDTCELGGLQQVSEDDLEVEANYRFLKAYLPRVLMEKKCLPNKGEHIASELHLYGYVCVCM